MNKSELLGIKDYCTREFNDEQEYNNKKLGFPKSIIVRRGDVIDAIGFVYTNGSITHGGPGGGKENFDLQPEEYITKVTGRYTRNYFGASALTGITFITNKGRSFAVSCNKQGESSFSYNVNSDSGICCMFGGDSHHSDGTVFIACIGFYDLPISKGNEALEGYAMPVQNIHIVDHTYVHSFSNGAIVKKYGCHGREDGGKVICKGYGDITWAEKIAKPDGSAGIRYGIDGVCHQMANRILYPAGIIVSAASGYSLSSLIYGTYGHGEFNPDVLKTSTLLSIEGSPHFHKVKALHSELPKRSDMNINEQIYQEFKLLMEERLNKSVNLLDTSRDNQIKQIINSVQDRKKLLDNQLNKKEISNKIYATSINSLAQEMLDDFAKILSKEEFKQLFNISSSESILLIDPEQMSK